MPQSIDPAAPNGIVGPAISAMDPAAADPQSVGQAMDAVSQEPYDPAAAAIAAGGRLRITSQAQYDALPEAQKAVVRAAVATGGRLRANDALRVYQDTVKQARANTPHTHTLPDGRTVTMINNQIVPEQKQPEAVKMERWNADDGTVMLTDPTTGRSFPAWDEQTGAPVRATPKLSETQKQKATSAQNMIDANNARLQMLQNFDTNSKVSWDANEMKYSSGYFGKNAGEEINRLNQENIRQAGILDNVLNPSGNAPTKSSPTPKATPAPTPDSFVVGKRYRDANGNTAVYKGNGKFE